MKKPRVEDFDPNAPGRELASPLDDMPQIQHPALTKAVHPPVRPQSPHQELRQQQSPSEMGPVSTSVSTYVRTPVRRTITRYAFDFFQDQLEHLRRFSLEEKGRGEKGSMSQMVREAVDAYIAKRHRVDK